MSTTSSTGTVTYQAKDFENHVTTEHDSTTSFLNATIDLSNNPPAVQRG